MPKFFWTIAIFCIFATPGLGQHGQSPYAGQEQFEIKALSAEEMQALLSGHGMGLAKAAELNRYPGPRHVLDLAAPLQLSETQRAETQKIYDRMHREAVRLGALIIGKECELEHLFATGTVTADTLQRLATHIARLRGDLRLVHLQAHVEMKRVLSPEQIDAYDALRGYTASADTTPPTGHHRHQH